MKNLMKSPLPSNSKRLYQPNNKSKLRHQLLLLSNNLLRSKFSRRAQKRKNLMKFLPPNNNKKLNQLRLNKRLQLNLLLKNKFKKILKRKNPKMTFLLKLRRLSPQKPNLRLLLRPQLREWKRKKMMKKMKRKRLLLQLKINPSNNLNNNKSNNKPTEMVLKPQLSMKFMLEVSHTKLVKKKSRNSSQKLEMLLASTS